MGRPHTWYGDPDMTIEEMSTTEDTRLRPNGPEVGDELCDGHQMHYEWDGERWA